MHPRQSTRGTPPLVHALMGPRSQTLQFVLFETASGYSLFEVKDVDAVGLSTDSVQESITNMERFSKIVTLSAFKPFATAADALEQVNAVSESSLTEMLQGFLVTNLPKVKAGKKPKFSLGVLEPKLASSILEATGERPRVGVEVWGDARRRDGVRQRQGRVCSARSPYQLQRLAPLLALDAAPRRHPVPERRHCG